MGLFRFNSTVLDYNSGYLGLGFTVDWKNSSFVKNTTKKYFNLHGGNFLSDPEPFSVSNNIDKNKKLIEMARE
jgi:hypothetical protein